MKHALLTVAETLPVDTDHLVRETEHTTQLLLRLGEGQTYPDERHQTADETILVLRGKCDIEIEDTTIALEAGDQVTVAAGLAHRFLPSSDCCLSVLFEQQSSPNV